MPQPAIESAALPANSFTESPWYRQVTAYQWLVLAIASAGWICDAFEGQLFTMTRRRLLHDLLISSDPGAAKFWGDVLQGVFLAGGTLGGIFFGNLADRIGRKPVMAITILFYSVFSGLTYFAGSLWHVAILRFLVAIGVGGEWAVAAALVAEVFPARARARAGGIFHASSVIGSWMAALAGMIAASHWRYAYLVSVFPALLLFWVRRSLREPQRWQKANADHDKLGSFRELFGDPRWRSRAIFGLLLGSVGLATFWSVYGAGQDLTSELLARLKWDPGRGEQAATIAYGFVQATGLFAGMLCFGPLAERIGRRGTFLLWHLCALAIVPVACYAPHSFGQLLAILPVFGFFTGGMHAGYAIYFPELFPDHLRATGAGICFNGGRSLAAPVLWISAVVKSWPGVDLRLAVVIMSSLYLVGVVVLLFLPETKGRPLP